MAATTAAVLGGARLSSAAFPASRNPYLLLSPSPRRFSSSSLPLASSSLLPDAHRFSSLHVKATSSSEETSSSTDDILADLKEKWDGIENKSTVLLYGGDAHRFSSLHVKATSSSEETSSSTDDILADLKEKWDGIENKSTVLLYGGGAIVAVWLSSIVVGAINSVPVIAKQNYAKFSVVFSSYPFHLSVLADSMKFSSTAKQKRVSQRY
ncbi:hypothetical protein COCNU_03G001610 [Cocos nucifera]|uniref:Cyanobacterial aminoacyl-tRNA synthetase CAAD domain-containing protein n=1 Tax=Cocos nucifera TaxID=13894 RepID=A0A8K0I1A5_COCNU|nr:hypothetical protein COCNU_03G001610 [Cocos nucifera]